MPLSSPPVPGFMIVHGNRLEDLRSLAVEWMRRYPLAPLDNETVLVQSNGIAQWFKMALAEDPRAGDGQGCGIAAAIDVQLPARFLWHAYRQVLGSSAIPEASPLDRDGLSWRLMRLLPGLASDPRFAPLASFLADDRGLRKQYQLAQRLADLFDQYQVYRADWLSDWAAGRDRLRTSRRGMQALAAQDAWQPALWRALLDDLGDPGMLQSRAGVHRRFLDACAALDDAPATLARRVIVFGISSMPAQALEALAALSRVSQVLLCVHNPSRHHWADIVADQDLLRHAYRRQPRKAAHEDGALPAPAGLAAHGHPLLAAWGKQGRDYIALLDSHDEPDRYRQHFAAVSEQRIDLFADGEADTLLTQLQDDILDLRTLAETRERWGPVDPDADRSLRFHVAHGPQREVEILHDQLLDRFNADPSLRPRDVIVMVPDIDTYAPHIRAVFGQLDRSDPRHIPFTLADQGQRGREPLLVALDYLLRLPENRFTVSELLDLLDVAAIRRRFGIAPVDLPVLRRWIEGAGIRWGVDAAQRASLGLPAGQEQNTWRFGLRRMLLGYAVGGGECFEGIEPYDEVGGLEAALVGPLIGLLDTLESLRAELGRPATPAQWGPRLRAMLDAMFVPDSEADETLLARLEDLLEDWQALCETARLESPLPLLVMREAWMDGLDQRRLNQRFLAGAVNFCTLMPMRAIPFRVVCLLGMNDGDYPRSQPPLDFDLMGSDYRPGDRSRREDDRYLLLEALLSARDQLYVSWVGRSIRDNGERPPSVLVGQLRDHVAAGWRLDDERENGHDLLAALTVDHPLQPFSARYFRTGEEDRRLFSYAREWAALHRPAERAAPEPAAFAAADAEGAVELDTLQRFLADPLRHYFNQCLNVHFDEAEEACADDEPFAVAGLDGYQLSERLVAAGLQADDAVEADRLLQAEADRLHRSGLLPLGGFGELRRQALLQPLPDLLARVRDESAALSPVPPMPLDLPLTGTPLRLEGWLDGLGRDNAGGFRKLHVVVNALLDASGRLKWTRLVRPWLAHLAANAAGYPLTTVFVAADVSLPLAPLAAAEAQQRLSELAVHWLEGRSRPLPVAIGTACAWLAVADDESAARQAARTAFEGRYQWPGEAARNRYLARQYPGFEQLWSDGEFALWAGRLYGPLVEWGSRALAERGAAARQEGA